MADPTEHLAKARSISGPCEWSEPCESTGPIGYFTVSPDGLSRECRNCCDASDIAQAITEAVAGVERERDAFYRDAMHSQIDTAMAQQRRAESLEAQLQEAQAERDTWRDRCEQREARAILAEAERDRLRAALEEAVADLAEHEDVTACSDPQAIHNPSSLRQHQLEPEWEACDDCPQCLVAGVLERLRALAPGAPSPSPEGEIRPGVHDLVARGNQVHPDVRPEGPQCGDKHCYAGQRHEGHQGSTHYAGDDCPPCPACAKGENHA